MHLRSSTAESSAFIAPLLVFQFIGTSLSVLLQSALYHEDSSCAAYAFQCSQPNTRKVVSCRRFSIVISSIPESLLPLLKSAVPYVSATSQPRSPRRIDSPFVEILPGVFYLPGIVSEPVLPAPQRIEFVVFAANVLSTRHSPCPKSFSVENLLFPFLTSRNRAPHAVCIRLDPFTPSQISLLLNQTSHSLNLRLLNFSKYQPSSALPGRVSSSVFPAPPEYFIFFPHRCAPHPAPVSRNPESKTHCCCPCSRPFLLPKTQKTAASSSLAAVSV